MLVAGTCPRYECLPNEKLLQICLLIVDHNKTAGSQGRINATSTDLLQEEEATIDLYDTKKSIG